MLNLVSNFTNKYNPNCKTSSFSAHWRQGQWEKVVYTADNIKISKLREPFKQIESFYKTHLTKQDQDILGSFIKNSMVYLTRRFQKEEVVIDLARFQFKTNRGDSLKRKLFKSLRNKEKATAIFFEELEKDSQKKTVNSVKYLDLLFKLTTINDLNKIKALNLF